MRRLIYAVAFLAAVLIVPTYLYSQSTWRLPVPGALTTGSLIYARDANNLGAISAVASGQVLTSAGTGTAPAWSASLPVGDSSLTNIVAISTSLSPASIASTACSASGTHCTTTESFSPISGLEATDRVFIQAPMPTSYVTAKCRAIDADVTGDNTLRITFMKITSEACQPVSGTYHIFAIRT